MATGTIHAFRRNLLPPARTFYEQELGRLTRPNRKGWAQGRCPFHQSRSGKSFSVNLESGGFYCFGCDAKGGDVVAFLRLRECCDFPTACKLLGCWDNVDENERRRLASEAETRKRECGQAAQVRQTKRMQRLELRAEIHALVKIETKVSDRLTHLLQGAPPASENEVEDCWGALSLAFEDLRNCEAAYMAMIGSEYSL